MSDSNKVGRNAEDAIRTFLESGGYTVVPYGVEQTLKPVVDKLGYHEYCALNLDPLISRAPDFFVLSPDKKHYWLVEVKSIAQWDITQREWLKARLEPQTKVWKRVFAVIAIRSAESASPLDSHIRVGQLVISDNKLKVWPLGISEEMDWDQVQWENLRSLETLFGAGRGQDSWKQRCTVLVEAIRKEPNDTAESECLRKRWNELMP